MNRGMYTYAWDLAEEGIATVRARYDDAGINTVTLATSYHAGKFLRPHGPNQKMYMPEDGTVYFRPDFARYGRIKPQVNSLVDEFDALRELEKDAPDLRRVGWTVCLHNTRLGTAHPDLVARNAFGDPFPYSLCPVKPDVRAYMVNLCADLGDNYNIAALALETPGWLPYGHGFHHEFALLALTPEIETLLGLCFCDDCMDGARADGIDAEGLKRRTRSTINAFFEADEISSPPHDADGGLEKISALPEMKAFLKWRCRVVADLIGEVRAALDKDVELGVVPTIQTPNHLAWREGSDLEMLSLAADFLEVPAYQTGVAAIRDDVENVRRIVGPEARVNFILRPSHPNLYSAEEVKDAVQVLQDAGAQDIAFYNYGHLRLSALDWIKQAF